MKQKFFIFFLAIFLAFSAPQVFASEVTESHGNIRSLGMGGIWMSYVNDQDALFVNPAALSQVKGLNWQVLNVEVGTNGYETYQQLNGIDLSTPSSYNQLFGKPIWIRAEAKTALALPNFALGAYTETNTNMVLHNPGFPQFQTHFISDNGMALGGAFALAPFTSMGIAVKQISRWGGDQDIDLGVIAGGHLDQVGDQFKNKGRGYGVDVALKSELPILLNPSVSLVWQDVGSTAFQKTDGLEAPPRIHDNLSLGASTSLVLPGLDLVAGLEYRHITENDYQLGQKIHLGAEVSLPLIDLRGGISQGYAAYGVGINFFFLKFDIAKYTEEMGAYPGQTPQERYQVGLSIDLGFDADFKLTGSDGKRRKLKQRR
jgi:hypothetical protein